MRPMKTRGFLPWVPNLRRVEIEATSLCNMQCHNCDRSTHQAPSNEHMGLEQIERFVRQSLECGWDWWEIVVLGGEPTLHPQFSQVIEALAEYRKANRYCTIQVTSNGRGARVEQRLSELPDWVYVRNTAKKSNTQHFSSYNVAPADLDGYRDADFSRGCWITEKCGVGLTRYGFYPCGAGASIDRVFGFDFGLKSVGELTMASLRERLPRLCRLCGHFKDTDSGDRVDEEVMSASWRSAYERFRESAPKLTLY